MKFNRVIVSALFCLGLLQACEPVSTVPPAAPRLSLYQRLGEKPAITKVVDAFADRVAGDNRINRYFASTDIPRLKTNLVNQICEASGGPCTYTGRTMKATHAGMGVTDSAFDALVEDLVAALDQYTVGEREKKELLSLLGPMRSDIVER